MDFNTSHDVLPPSSRIAITLSHANDDFRLMSQEGKDGQYKLVVHKCQLIVTQNHLSDQLMQTIERRLLDDHALTYNIKRMQMIGPYQIARDSTIYSRQVARGPKPLCVFALFVSSDAGEGLF